MRQALSLMVLGLVSLGISDGVDDYVKAKMESDHLPGVAFAVVDPGGKVAFRRYGVANRETGELFTEKSTHRIASLSKQMCSYVALSLVRDGKLSLEDEVLQWLPQGNPAWKGMTVRHLMGHTSGIADPAGFSYSRDYSTDEYVALLAKAELETKPGEKYRYNNYAYGLLGELLGIAGGSSLPELARKYIFDPVGMAGTGYYVAGQKRANEVIAYRWTNGAFEIPLRERPRIFHGSGGVFSTLEDLVKYELALRSGVLDQKILEQQWTPSFPKAGRYGFGWNVGEGELTHTGTTFGYTSAFLRDRKAGWTVILFRNSDPGSQMDMAREILAKWRAQLASQSRQ